MKHPNKYVVWDLETSGLDPVDDKAVELAYIIVEDGDVIETYTTLIKQDIDIPPEATAIHGITDEMCDKDGVSEQEAFDHLQLAIASCDGHNVTHNGTRFDHLFLEQHLARAPNSLKVRNKHFDTAAYYKAKAGNLQRHYYESIHEFNTRVLETRMYGVKYNLSLLVEQQGIKLDGVAHRALTDAHATHELYKLAITPRV